MPSPFPGMNPFLEQEDAWSDFHERYIPAAAEEIGKQIQPAYIVRIEQNVYIHEIPDEGRTFMGRPDVFLTEGDGTAIPSVGSATLAAPTNARLIPLTFKEQESFIEIQDRHSRKVITAIELLSPTNKTAGSDRDQYLAKRERYLATGVHLVEVDLLRGGRRVPLDPQPTCDYCVVLSRAEDRPTVGVWPIQLRDRLPTVPVPLRSPDGDASLDLQSVLNRVYDAAGYGYYIYEHPPRPPLKSPEAEWAQQVLAALSQ
jgi:hypothetical protein